MFQKVAYNCTIQLYNILTHSASLFNKKARQRIVGLRNNAATLRKIKQEKSTSKNWQLAWFHAASLGEFEQARPVIEQFIKQHPSHKILITFFSPSGFEIRKNYPLSDYTLYLPFDLRSDAVDFIDTISPTIVFWVKYEYWRNFLTVLHQRNIPVLLISAIFRESQPFFQWYGKFFRQPLLNFSRLFVQDDASKSLLSSINIKNATVVGDTRFDRVADTLKTVREIEIVKRFRANQKLLVLGSAWEEDIACVGKVIQKHKAELEFVIAPHELHQEQIERWKKQFNGIRYSEVDNDTDLSEFDALIIDNIGLLSSIYQYADFAFIGGGFGKGLHNILEAATFGMPIFFGNKNYNKFKEAKELIALGGAFAIENSQDFQLKFEEQLANNQFASKITSDYVQRKTGATNRILEWLDHQNLYRI